MNIKNPFALAKLAVSIALFSMAAPDLNKSSQAAPSPQILAQNLSSQERRELQQLRQEKQKLQQLQQDKQMRELIQAEVDRAFSRATTLINILLFVMTLFPVVTAFGVWLLRRSVINQLVSEIKKELQTEVEKQLEAEVASEFKKQTEAFKQEMNKLQAEFVSHLSQLQALFIEAQNEKDQIIREISNIIPASLEEPIPPEIQNKMIELTNQLEALKAANSELIFTVDDYVKQGDALFFENRYEEAIECYDKAIQLEPNNVDVWFFKGYVLQKLKLYDEAIACYNKTIEIYPDEMDYWYYKACCYALQGDAELAVETLQEAANLNPRCLKWAKSNSDFDAIRQDERFNQLIDRTTSEEQQNDSTLVEQEIGDRLTASSENKVFLQIENQTLMAQDQYEMQNGIYTKSQPVLPTEELPLDNQSQVLSAEYYLKQGDACFSQKRYEEANKFYNEALTIERNLPEVRYQNARTYGLRGSVNPAIGNLQWAIDIDPKYKEMAKNDSAFDAIRETEQFENLIYESSSLDNQSL